MKFDSRYSAPIRPIFRVPALIIGAAQLFIGIFYLVDGGFKVGLPQTIMGLMFMTAGIKGRLPRWIDAEEREKIIEKQISDGKSVTRRVCLLSLGGLVLVVTILISIFLTAEIYSFGWWVGIVLTIFSSVGFYLNSAILLESKGFHPSLAFTVIFPISLLAIGAINPKRYEHINIA